ncbi:MAG: hypothetical protein IPK97_04580 [Ahniella sp.]|nr:hypothetical protein [Ahniella sp.]
MHIALVLLFGSKVVHASDFSSGFEDVTPGTLLGWTLLPEPGSILAADATPTISASFVPWLDGAVPMARVIIDGSEMTGIDTAPETVVLSLAQPLPEGPHEILLILSHQGVETQSRWSFHTQTAPQIHGFAPVDGLAYDEDNPVQVRADFSDVGAGIDPAQVRLFIDGQDVSTTASATDNSVSLVRDDLTNGRHTIRLAITDRAGNTTEVERWFQFGAIPLVSERQPPPGTPVDQARPLRVGARIDGGSRVLVPESIRLWLDGIERTAEIQINLQPGGKAAEVLLDTVPPAPGAHTVRLVTAAQSGAQVDDDWAFTAVVPEYSLEILEPPSGTIVDGPSVRIRVAAHTNVDLPQAIRAGMSVCRLQDFTEVRGEYQCLVNLEPGETTIPVEAKFEGGIRISDSLTVTRAIPFQLTLDTPMDLQTFGPLDDPAGNSQQLTGTVARPVVVTGRSNRPLSSVLINQQAAELTNAGMGFRFDRFFLHEGTNLITAVGIAAEGGIAGDAVTVYSDQTAPLLTVFAPEPDSATSSQTLNIRGRVVDVVGPIVGSSRPTVRIRNLDSGYEQTALVSGQHFRAKEFPLLVGRNRLSLLAVDSLGNERTQAFDVTRIQAGALSLSVLSGDDQTGVLGQALPEPLMIRLADASGDPVAGQPVRFDLIRGSGHFPISGAIGSDGLNPPRNRVVQTDAEGVAALSWILGKEGGIGGQLLRASVDGTAERVYFSANGLPGAPRSVKSDGTSASQFVTTGQAVLEPLTINVLDEFDNPVADAPVRFRILGGQATLLPRAGVALSPDAQTADLASGEHGVAAMRLRAGAQPGSVVVVAELLGPDSSIIDRTYFQLKALLAQAGPTRFSGVVRSDAGVPLEGVRVSIDRTSLLATTDAAGLFRFEDQVPPGRVDLFVDGRDVSAGPGRRYPSLHFEASVSPGQDNQLMHAIHLPPIDLDRAVEVGGAQDVSITLPGVEGFRMTVKGNSVTFPDGSRIGPLTVTAIIADRLPMVPQGGASSFGAVAWTIQPSGTRFDPPIEVTMPNITGLRPGQSVPLFQWDHDLATFVPMGLATVSEDAAELVSEPGMGISKAGWGGGPPPVPPNDGENDPPSCPVRGAAECDCDGANTTQRPTWTIKPAERVGFPVIQKLGFMFQENSPEQKPLECKKCPNKEVWYIAGGDALITRVQVATNLPRMAPPAGFKPRTAAQIQQTIEHENVHATKVDEIKTKHWSYLEGKFGTPAECQAAVNSAIERFQDDYEQAHYRQCLHLDHSGQPIFTADAEGNQVPSGLSYPLRGNMEGFAACEAMPH